MQTPWRKPIPKITMAQCAPYRDSRKVGRRIRLLRMRDSGDTIMFLEDVAGDLTSDTRLDAMRDIALEHGVYFDEENSLFASDWVDRSKLGDSAIRFMSFLNRLQDVALLHKERAASVFEKS